MPHPHRQDPDVRLMLAVAADTPGAFESFVARFAPMLVNFLYRQAGAHDVAEDLGQEVFLRVYRTRMRYEPRARLRTWLLTIATNVFLNRERYEGYRRHLSLDAASGDDAFVLPVEDADGAAPHEGIEKAELRERVRDALRDLPDNQRLAVDMLRFSGMSYREIGDAMDLTVQAVKSLLNRAKANLRARLERDVEEYVRAGQVT